MFDTSPPQATPPDSPILKSVIHNLAEGVVVADSRGKLLLFNRVAETILGIAALDVEPSAWSTTYGCYRTDKITPFPSEELPLARAIAGESTREVEIYIRNPQRPSGAWIAVKGDPLRDATGELCGGMAVFRNITRSKQREEYLRMLTEAVEQTADTIVITDKNGTVLYVNPAFENTTGFRPDEILGRTPSVLKSGLHDGDFYRNLWGTINSGRVYRGTITNRKKSGTLYFAEQTITPMRDSAGTITHFVSVLKDVTEQRKMQEQEYQLGLARTLQQQFYNLPPPQIQGLDLAGVAFPAAATGGDYFDFILLPDGCLGTCMGDVAGHGFSSALLMVQVRTCMRAFAQKAADAGEMLTLVNRSLVCDIDVAAYITLAFCRVNVASRSIAYASAGHVPGYILDSAGHVRHVLQSTGIPLGISPETEYCSEQATTLAPDEILVWLTDGILEAEGPEQKEFGASRALAYIQAHRQESARQIAVGLCEAVRAFLDGYPQYDDISVVICKSVGSPA